MALTVSRGDLRTEIRRQTDTENDPHVVDAEIDSWINKGIRVLHGEIQQVDPDFFIVTTTLTTVAGTKEYAFTSGSFSPGASDFRAIRRVDYTLGGDTITLRSFPFEEGNRRGPLVAGTGYLPRYRVMRNGTNGASAVLAFDIDPGARDYTVHYLPVPTSLDNDSETVDGVMGWDDYVIAYAAKRVHLKSEEKEMAAYCEAEMARVLRDVRILGSQRHADGQDRIARTRRRRGLTEYHSEF